MVFDRELLKGNTDSLLLAVLVDRPQYGYELLRAIEARSKGYFRLKEGTLYPALHRLEREGLIEAHWKRSASGQQRRYYAVTEKGLRANQSRLVEWRDFARAMNLVVEPSTA